MLQWLGTNIQDVSSRLVIGDNVNATIDIGTNDVLFATGFGGASTGSLTKVGSGTLSLTAANTYTGGTTLGAGTLVFSSGALGATGAISLNSGTTLQWAAGNTQDISQRLAVATGTNTTLDLGNNSITFAGTIGGSGSASLVMGSGTLTLGANNTFHDVTLTGGTIDLNGHTLTVSGTLSFQGTQAGLVENGALVLAGSGITINGVGSGVIDGTTITASGDSAVDRRFREDPHHWRQQRRRLALRTIVSIFKDGIGPLQRRRLRRRFRRRHRHGHFRRAI